LGPVVFSARKLVLNRGLTLNESKFLKYEKVRIIPPTNPPFLDCDINIVDGWMYKPIRKVGKGNYYKVAG
jgi:hypothetical protein